MKKNRMSEATEDERHPKKMRILFLGNKAAGKSSSISTILGRDKLSVKTAQCVKSQGQVEGTEVTVIEAPGWWRNYMVKDTPNLNTQEIILSASLCPPLGPHAVLLVIRLDTRLTERCRRALEQRQLLFQSENVWKHSVVLFTFGDCLGDTTIEKHIEKEGKALQWVVKKCGNRFHVFNNKNRSDSRQVKELMEKIEDLVVENDGCSFEMDFKCLFDLRDRRSMDEKKAMERLSRVQAYKQAIACSTDLAQPDLRILLVGHRHSGKSSVGNTILGREEFDLRRTSKCVIKAGQVAGRMVTVVEAPGWWNNYRSKHTPELNKQELLCSASLCPPGPHVVLLVIRVDGSFIPDNKISTKEHLEPFEEKVWDYTMVLFTYGDWLGETSIEQHIESEGESLQSIVEKCGNRYHLINNQKYDHIQVTELLQKIEEMMARNDKQHYEVNSVSLKEVQEQQKAEKERAKLRTSKMMEKRQTLRSVMGVTENVSELRIVMFGSKYSGKTSAGNTIFGSQEVNLEITSECMRWQGQIGTRQIVLVEAPGWSRSYVALATVKTVNANIRRSVNLCAPGPNAVLIVIQADTSFTEDERKTLEKRLRLFDGRIWNHVMVLFTCGDWLGDWTVEEYIESEGEALRWLVEMCGNRYHVLNNKDNSEDTQVTELLDKIEEMVADNDGYIQVQLELQPQQLRHQDEDDEKKEEMTEKDEINVVADDIQDDYLDEATPTCSDTMINWKSSDLKIHKAHSMQHCPPTMGTADCPDTTSDCGSEASFAMSSIYNSFTSVASTMSSGIGSLRNFGTQGFSALHGLLKRSKPVEDNNSAEIGEKNRKQDL